MAGDEVGKVSFGIEANFDGKGITDAERSLDRLGAAASVAAGILAADFARSVLDAAKQAATFAFTVTKAASTAVESLDLMAQATGITIQQFQELEPVMRRNNVSAEQMGSIFRILSKNIQEAKDPSSNAAKAFDNLGLTMTGLESPAEVFGLIANRIKQLPDGFLKTRLETELLGRSGTQLTAVLNEGAEGFRRSALEARAMGNVLSTAANKALLDVNDSFDKLAVAQDNLSKHIALLFAPMVQGANEARIAMLNLAVTFTDNMTIATRTLAVRLEALFGFLKAQAQLSITEVGKIPEIYERWSHWAEEQISAIRKQSITTQELGNSIGKVDEKAQAAARASAKATERFFYGLTQMDMGWKIVQESIDAYGHSQEALGRFIVTQLIASYKELQTTSALWAQTDFNAANRNIEQFKAMEVQYRATAAAGNQAALAGGRISPVEFERRSGELATEAIEQEINAQRKAIDAMSEYYGKKIILAQGDNNAQRELIQQQISAVADANNRILVLEEQRRTQGITNSSAMEQANLRMYQANLEAAASSAQAELNILQSTYADTESLRAARLAVIDASLQQELAKVGLTESQKIAIYRNAEAERIGIARQFPTFFEKQMQDLVAGNAFSLAQISQNFTNATAQWIVTGKGFEQFWTQLQVTLVQSFLNSLVQLFANWVLHTTAMEAATTAFEGAKTAIFGTGEGARLGIAKATNTAMSAMALTHLGTIMAIGNASLAIAAAVAEAIAGIMYAAATAAAIIPGGQGLAGALIAGATALSIGTAAATGVALGVIQGAAGAAIISFGAAAAFAKGGIVTGPTFGMIGEAGSSEAVIPLNKSGAAFMADMLGLSGGSGSKQQIISLSIDGASFRRWILEGMPDEVRLRAGAIA